MCESTNSILHASTFFICQWKKYIYMVVKYERQFSVIAYLIGVILGICGNQIGIEKMFFIVGILMDLC